MAEAMRIDDFALSPSFRGWIVVRMLLIYTVRPRS